MLIAGGLALLAVPDLFSSFATLKGAAVGSLCFFLVLMVWFQRENLPEQLFPWILALAIFWAVTLTWNAEQLKRAANVWQFMTLAGRTPWTGGHTLGIALSFPVLVLLFAMGSKPGSPPQDHDEILSGPRLIPLEEARRLALRWAKPAEKTIFWAGVELPESCATEHFAIVGTPGSGKTLSLHLLMKSVLPGIRKGSNRRAVIYDAKRDTCSIVAGILGTGPDAPPVWILNPFDSRSSPWRMNQDIRDGATAFQIASILIPEGTEKSTFFVNASRALLGGVMEAFVHLAPDEWTFRDVILTMRQTSRVMAVLSACPETSYLIGKFMTDSTRDSDIDATVETHLRSLSFVAAAWHKADREPVSLNHWIESESILILGVDPSFDIILQALNRALFQRMVELTRHLPDVLLEESRQTWFIIDELRNAGVLEDIDKLLVEGRSKGACVVIGFQDLAGLREVFGEKRADEIIGACANKVFLQNGEQTTIEYATKHFKSQEVLETRVSHSRSETFAEKGSVNVGYNVNRQRVMRPVIHEGLLKSLPKPVRGRAGLSGYCDTAAVGTEFPYRVDLSTSFLDAELPRPDKNVEGVNRRKLEDMKLPDWTIDDLKRLNLQNHPELLNHGQPTEPTTDSRGSEPPQDDPPPGGDHDIFGL